MSFFALFFVAFLLLRGIVFMTRNNKEAMMKHPDWALKFKTKNTELRLIRGKYYLYNITSKWDPVKKRPKTQKLKKPPISRRRAL